MTIEKTENEVIVTAARVVVLADKSTRGAVSFAEFDAFSTETDEKLKVALAGVGKKLGKEFRVVVTL